MTKELGALILVSTKKRYQDSSPGVLFISHWDDTLSLDAGVLVNDV